MALPRFLHTPDGFYYLPLPHLTGRTGPESLAPCGLVSVEKAFLEAFGLDVAKGGLPFVIRPPSENPKLLEA